MNFFSKLAVLILYSALNCQYSLSQTVFDSEQVSVIQQRIFDAKHEINLSSGYVPDDDYYESYALGVGYTYHFSQHLAWEVIRGQYYFNEEKELKSQLEEEFQVTPETFDHLAYMAHSSLVIKPTYGKDAIFNRGIINHESYYSVGVGLSKFQRDYSFEESTEETALSVTLGAGRRFFLSKSFALTFDLKSYTNFKALETETNVYLGMGMSYRFNISNYDSVVRDKTSGVYEYLNDD